MIGGVLAGASNSGSGGQLWGVPAIPVEPSINLALALSLFYGGMILLVRAWVQLRRWVLLQTTSSDMAERQGRTPRSVGVVVAAVLGVTGIWVIPFLVGPPLGSRDVYAYAAQGRMAETGIDVYNSGPGVLGDDPVLTPMDPIYRDAPVVYGPVFVEVSAFISRLSWGPNSSVYFYRLLSVAGLAAAIFGVWDLAHSLGRNRVDALVMTIANPLVLLHLVSGAHNESIMLGFLIGGMAIGRRAQWRWLGVLLCIVGAAIKIPAILGVAFVAWPWITETRSRLVQGARAGFVGVMTFATLGLVGVLTGWGWGWLGAIQRARPVDAYLSVTRVIGGGVQVLIGTELDVILTVLRPAGLVVAGLATLYLLISGSRNAPVALGWSLLLFAVLHPTTQPWYLTWGLLLIAAGSAGARNRAFMMLSGFAAFVVLPAGPQLGLALLADTGSGVIALIMAGLVLLTLSPTPTPIIGGASGLNPDLISVIVPTRNESPNIAPLVRRVGDSLLTVGGSAVEVIFVDDSEDHTAFVIQELVDKSKGPTWSGPQIRLTHRRRGGRWGGLGGAVVDGFAKAKGSVVVVIDGDLQHPPEEIPTLVSQVRSGADLVVASRRIDGGSGSQGLTTTRDWMSRWAAKLSRTVFPQRVGRVADPLSGFFALRLDRIDQSRLHPDGFKILIEILATHSELSTVEVPFRFARRVEGESKVSLGQGARFLSHLMDLRLRTSRPWAGSVGTQRIFRSS